MVRATSHSRRSWMFKTVMGWRSFYDLWQLAVRRRGDPPAGSSLLVERARKHLVIWESGPDEPLRGCGSFDLAMPEGFSFMPDELRYGRPLPREGTEDSGLSGWGDLGPVIFRWVKLDALDDQVRERTIAEPRLTIPAWPVFKDDSPAFDAAMLDQIHSDYWHEIGKRRDFVWEAGDKKASLYRMPAFEGGHWQVYLERYDFFTWLSDPHDPRQSPQKFPTREAAAAAALAARSSW